MLMQQRLLTGYDEGHLDCSHTSMSFDLEN